MKRMVLTMVLAGVVAAIGLTAQAPPQLSGTWRPQNPNSGQANPFEFTITQAADSVTMEEALVLIADKAGKTPAKGKAAAKAKTAKSTDAKTGEKKAAKPKAKAAAKPKTAAKAKKA